MTFFNQIIQLNSQKNSQHGTVIMMVATPYNKCNYIDISSLRKELLHFFNYTIVQTDNTTKVKYNGCKMMWKLIKQEKPTQSESRNINNKCNGQMNNLIM